MLSHLTCHLLILRVKRPLKEPKTRTDLKHSAWNAFPVPSPLPQDTSRPELPLQHWLDSVSLKEMLWYIGSGLALKLEGTVSSRMVSTLDLRRIQELFDFIQRYENVLELLWL